LDDLVSPTLEAMMSLKPKRLRKFYSTFINAMGKIALQYKPGLLPTVDGIMLYFPRTRDFTNFSAITDVLECSLKQMERRNTLSTQMVTEKFPAISYRITIDYQTYFESEPGDDVDYYGPASTWPLIRRIGYTAPANIIVVGSELHKTVTASPQLLHKYKFENLEQYLIHGRKDSPYAIYSLTRR
jgi:hypothetical protein